MAGLYIHIPYCRKACHYCNFHFSTNLSSKTHVIEAICREIEERKTYLKGANLTSIYFGGGTPSILNSSEIAQILDTVNRQFTLSDGIEITIEANPEDITIQKLDAFADMGINRLSLGVQSFFDADLVAMNRAHDARQAICAIQEIQRSRIDRLSVDLIFGSSTTSDEMWEENLIEANKLGIDHLSCYALTIEPRTALAHMIAKGKRPAFDEEKSSRHFEMTMDYLTEAGYDHYEISSYGRNGDYAQHNTHYWKGMPYLGVGPAAHSFDLESRRWNVSHNTEYINAFNSQNKYWEEEILSPADKYNEYIMTKLRTKWGIERQEIEYFGLKFLNHFEKSVESFVSRGLINATGNVYNFTKDGKQLADHICMNLFVEAENEMSDVPS